MNRSLCGRAAQQEGQSTEGMAWTKRCRGLKKLCVVRLTGARRLMWQSTGPLAGVVGDKWGGAALASLSRAEGIGFIFLEPWGLWVRYCVPGGVMLDHLKESCWPVQPWAFIMGIKSVQSPWLALNCMLRAPWTSYHWTLVWTPTSTHLPASL